MFRRVHTAFVFSPYDAALRTAGFDLVEDSELRDAIGEWVFRASDLEESRASTVDTAQRLRRSRNEEFMRLADQGASDSELLRSLRGNHLFWATLGAKLGSLRISVRKERALLSAGARVLELLAEGRL